MGKKEKTAKSAQPAHKKPAAPQLASIEFGDFWAGLPHGKEDLTIQGVRRNPEWARAVSEDGWTPLLFMSHRGRARAVKELIPLSDIEQAPAPRQNTALLQAAHSGGVECLRLLLPVANLSAKNAIGNTALAMAAGGGRVDCVRELLPLLDAKAVNDHGMTALMIAAARNGTGNLACVKTLAPASDFFAKDPKGRTALNFAIEERVWECADFLAASMSADCARKLLSLASKKLAWAAVDLPLCRVAVEQAEIQAAAEEAAQAANAGACAAEESARVGEKKRARQSALRV